MASRAQETIERIDWLVARHHALASPRGPAEGAMLQEPSKKAALRDVARALEGIGARYALIGGVAVAVHADFARATHDLDVAVLSSVPRARARAALEGAGLVYRSDHRHTTNYRHPSGEPVQLVFAAEFDEAIARATHVEIDGREIAIVTKADLIAMKERSGADPQRRRSRALQDQADVAILQGDVPDDEEAY